MEVDKAPFQVESSLATEVCALPCAIQFGFESKAEHPPGFAFRFFPPPPGLAGQPEPSPYAMPSLAPGSVPSFSRDPKQMRRI